MKKIDHGLESNDSGTEQAASPTVEPVKRSRRSVVPAAPMTDEEHEAARELLKMMDIKREDFSEERLKEISRLWE